MVVGSSLTNTIRDVHNLPGDLISLDTKDSKELTKATSDIDISDAIKNVRFSRRPKSTHMHKKKAPTHHPNDTNKVKK